MSELREKLTKGKDVVDPRTWAGAIPAAFGIAPRVRIGSNRGFNLLWLLPIGWGALLLAVAAAQYLRASTAGLRAGRRLAGNWPDNHAREKTNMSINGKAGNTLRVGCRQGP